MLSKLTLVHCLEVSRQALGLHGVANRHVLHNSLGRVRVHETEIFEILVVRGGVVEVGGDVSGQPTQGEHIMDSRDLK